MTKKRAFIQAFFLILLSLSFVQVAEANKHSPSYRRKFYRIGRVEIREIRERDDTFAVEHVKKNHFPFPYEQIFSSNLAQDDLIGQWSEDLPVLPSSPSPNQAQMVDESIIRLGKEVWQVVVDNKPVVNVKTDKMDVLPEGSSSWLSVHGWKRPRSRLYRVTYRNLLGLKVVSFTYRVLYTYGGNQNGVGHYLANVSVIPSNISVAWGFKFALTAGIPNVHNAGTSNDPVAAAEVMVSWNIDTPLTHREESELYYVKGDGEFSEL
jgi:hypothetical protein